MKIALGRFYVNFIFTILVLIFFCQCKALNKAELIFLEILLNLILIFYCVN
jgi:hypothetical protein